LKIVDKTLKKNKHVDFTFSIIFIVLYIVIISILGYVEIIDYGIFGVTLIVLFYLLSGIKRYVWAGIILCLLSFKNLLINGFGFWGSIQFLSILTIPILMIYNNQKGKLNLKYLFFTFYPLHLFIL